MKRHAWKKKPFDPKNPSRKWVHWSQGVANRFSEWEEADEDLGLRAGYWYWARFETHVQMRRRRHAENKAQRLANPWDFALMVTKAIDIIHMTINPHQM